ncbi:MAG TPA: lytic transglycosylase domain-containing protein [Alphaproteobacteria bacterium]|nr:lytic transglycosylase domain-containing protein [Alphaproteobacteria bacterium]
MGPAPKTAETIPPRPSLAKRGAGWLAGLMVLFLAGAVAAQERLLSQGDVRLYEQAFDAAGDGNWDEARRLAARADEDLPAKVIRWLDLSRADGDQTYQEAAGFLAENPTWPGQGALRLQVEARMPPGLPAADLVAWFDQHPPLTFDAVMRYASALEAVGRGGDAADLARERWVDIAVTESQQQRFLARFGDLFTPDDHWARLDALLWSERATEARRMMPLVDAGRRALAEARLRLAGQEGGVDAAINRVPDSLADDEGLIYERVRWRRRADLTEEAIALLARQPAELSQPAAWWTERAILARRLFNDGDYAGAYAVASGHQQDDAATLSEAEWLAGWVALRFLDEPDLAVGHFQRLYDAVGTPISLGRGAYWLGRSYEAAGNAADAERWYAVAAQYDSVFYGQLAAGELGRPSMASLAPMPEVPQAAAAAFARGEFARLARMLVQIGERNYAETFLNRMIALNGDPISLALVGDLALDLGLQQVAIRAGKLAIRDGLLLTEPAFPVQPIETADRRVDPALVLALIRQESEFDTRAVSRAGARGLMQLMPATADWVAGRLGIDHATGMLTAHPTHNIRLGSYYLAQQIERFQGSYVMAVAGYNGGPNRVAGWIDEMGDPRGGAMDLYQVIDWIEAIPLPETRNYVQRVLENTQVYRLRLGGRPEIGALEEDLLR